MKLRGSFVSLTLALAGLMAVGVGVVAQPRPQRDPLGFLKRSITEAGAPALTSQQETQLNDLITAFRQAQPHGPDEALQAARTAYDNALLAGDLAAAQAQAAIIANRTAALSNARLQAEAKFKLDALAVLRTGGQFEPLKQKFGNERLLGLVGSLIGGFGGGRPGFGPGGPPMREGFGRPRPGEGN
jgi:Spy/CpxP family protein refolding chaperone